MYGGHVLSSGIQSQAVTGSTMCTRMTCVRHYEMCSGLRSWSAIYLENQLQSTRLTIYRLALTKLKNAVQAVYPAVDLFYLVKLFELSFRYLSGSIRKLFLGSAISAHVDA